MASTPGYGDEKPMYYGDYGPDDHYDGDPVDYGGPGDHGDADDSQHPRRRRHSKGKRRRKKRNNDDSPMAGQGRDDSPNRTYGGDYGDAATLDDMDDDLFGFGGAGAGAGAGGGRAGGNTSRAPRVSSTRGRSGGLFADLDEQPGRTRSDRGQPSYRPSGAAGGIGGAAGGGFNRQSNNVFAGSSQAGQVGGARSEDDNVSDLGGFDDDLFADMGLDGDTHNPPPQAAPKETNTKRPAATKVFGDTAPPRREGINWGAFAATPTRGGPGRVGA